MTIPLSRQKIPPRPAPVVGTKPKAKVFGAKAPGTRPAPAHGGPHSGHLIQAKPQRPKIAPIPVPSLSPALDRMLNTLKPIRPKT